MAFHIRGPEADALARELAAAMARRAGARQLCNGDDFARTDPA